MFSEDGQEGTCKCFVQPTVETQRDSVYNDIKQRRAVNPHTGETKPGNNQHYCLMNNSNNETIIKIAAEECTNYVTSTDK